MSYYSKINAVQYFFYSQDWADIQLNQYSTQFFSSFNLMDWCSIPLWSGVGLKGLFEVGFANRHIRLVFPSISLTLLFVTVFRGVQSLLFRAFTQGWGHHAWMLKRRIPACPNGTMLLHLQWAGLASGIHFAYLIQVHFSSGHFRGLEKSSVCRFL